MANQSSSDKKDQPAPSLEEQLAQVRREKEFIGNWLSDLIDTMDDELDEETRRKLFAGCGRGCFYRHSFKQDIAHQGQGDLQKLIAAYRRNFEIWQEGDEVHIRYGAVSPGCYCPAAKSYPAKEGDLHCECTRSTHQTIFEEALGRAIRVQVVESVRRGDPTCHFVVYV